MTQRTAAQHRPDELRYLGCSEDRAIVWFAADSKSQPGKVNTVAWDTVDRAALQKQVEPLWAEFSGKYPTVKPVVDEIVATRA